MKTGFTLIELSIVLAIIGLLVGGVVAGSSMIESAKVSAQITQLSELTKAHGNFALKYNALPGDMERSKAIAYTFSVAPSSYAGAHTGNGAINGYASTSCSSQHGIYKKIGCINSVLAEPAYYFRHLIDSGFLDTALSDSNLSTPIEAGKQFPKTKLGLGAIAAMSTDRDLRYYLGFAATSGGNHFTAIRTLDEGLTPMEAYELDRKMDDGSPDSGIIQAAYMHGTWGVFQNNAINANNAAYNLCTVSSGGVYRYNTTVETRECNLAVKTINY